MEELQLTTPVTTPAKTKNKYHVISLVLDMEYPNVTPIKPGLISIVLKDNNNELFNHRYTGDEAVDLMKFLNTANLTVKSMHKRILEKLSADGVLPGTVVGAPDAMV